MQKIALIIGACMQSNRSSTMYALRACITSEFKGAYHLSEQTGLDNRCVMVLRVFPKSTK